MKTPIDRGGAFRGMDKTTRDSRQPFSSPRLLENFGLPDGRSRRRRGYKTVHEPVKTQALCKSTPVSYSKKLQETNHSKGTTAISPLSYGLIRWQTDYQLRRAEPKTIEFMFRLGDKEELVANNFVRVATYPGSWTNYSFRSGVYLYDQTLLSNGHIWNDGLVVSGAIFPGTTWNMTALASPTQFDVLPTNALSFYFDSNNLYVSFGLVESTGANTGRYWQGFMLHALGTYVAGTNYHVALTYDPAAGAGPGRFILYVNGAASTSFDIPVTVETFKFVGEYDVINGVTYAAGQKRDIVLLNECTARASYSSSCKIRGDMHGHQTFFHDYSFIPSAQQINTWALSPPRGTAMWDLRIWNEVRSAGNVLANAKKRILDTGTANLKGNWFLNEGGPICSNHVTGRERHYCTVHHGYPGYVTEAGLLSGQGIKLGEGQHLIKSFGRDDRHFGSGLAAKLCNIFDDDIGAGYLVHRDQHSFTVQIQILVPDAFQPELNDKGTDPLTMRDLALVETRRAMNTGCSADYDSLLDGTAEAGAAARFFIGHATDPVPGPDIQQHLRAYDQTLWSIEGVQLKTYTATSSPTNEAERRRIPVARGVLAPDGRVIFELFKSQTGGLQPKYCRLRSASSLVVGNVYTLTFVQRVNYVYTGGTNTMDASGWVMEIWIENVTAGTPPALSSSFTFAAGSIITTGALAHEQDYDISIGASYVNDGWDHSINMPFPNGPVATPKSSFLKGGGAIRADHGPWPVQQRFMSPYQDQPGNFTVGMFRMWSISLSNTEIARVGHSKLVGSDRSSDLLINLEFSEKTGVEIPNKSIYPDTFRLGYKGWGMPQSYRNFIYQTINLNAYLKKELFEGTWAYEDCLGYMPITDPTYDSGQRYTRVNGLAAFKASFGQQYGTLAVYGDAIAFDESVTGTYLPLHLANHGLMSELVPGLNWNHTIVGDRTILTSPNALPKVFDGKSINTAGFRKWNGGTPVLYETAAVPGALVNGWYGVVVVYFQEKNGTYIVSPVATCEVFSTNAIGLFMVPQHPDNRVTLIEVYRTLPQATESLAKSAPLFKTRMGAGSTVTVGVGGGNCFCESITIAEADANLPNVVLDRNVTEMPVCAYAASLNDRLYLVGDVLNPDIVYFSDPGNPERIDIIANSLKIPQGSGDFPTGIIAAFEAIFIFKPNAIWRLDDVGGNRHQFTRMASVGAVSDRSIQLITDPDTGRESIFFWSQHGPYKLDTSGVQYLGYPIEESKYAGDGLPEYNWLNPSSVVVGHDIGRREIICFYTPKRTDANGVTTQLDRNGEAFVYNYRVNGWYRYTGTICTNALSLVYGTSSIFVDSVTNRLQGFVYKLVVGGENGRLYYWGESKTDGIPTGLALANPYSLAINSQYEYKPVGFDASKDYIGLWVTIVNTDGRWFSAPITSYDATLVFVHVDETWTDTQKTFTVTQDCKLYFGQVPAMVELAWDQLEVSFWDKKLQEFITWHDTLFKYRIGFNNVDIPLADSWLDITDSDSQRKRTQVNRACETVKLQLASSELDATFDAIVYNVAPTKGASLEQ